MNKADPSGRSVECGDVWYKYTTWDLNTGEITNARYGTEWECHDVPSVGGKGGGPGGAGETAGRAPADTGCTSPVLGQPGIRALAQALQRMSTASGLEEGAVVYREGNGFWWGAGVKDPIIQTNNLMDFDVPDHAWQHAHSLGEREERSVRRLFIELTHPLYNRGHCDTGFRIFDSAESISHRSVWNGCY